MADGTGLIPLHLQVEEAQKEANALAKKLAKTKIEMGIKLSALDSQKEIQKNLKSVYDEAKAKLDKLAYQDISNPDRWIAKSKRNLEPVENRRNPSAPMLPSAEIAEALEAMEQAREELEKQSQIVDRLQSEYDSLNSKTEDAEQHYRLTAQYAEDLQEAMNEPTGDDFWDAFTKAVDSYNSVMGATQNVEMGVFGVSDALKAPLLLLKNTIPAVFNGLDGAIGIVDGLSQRVGELATNLGTDLVAGFFKAGKALNPFMASMNFLKKNVKRITHFISEILQNDAGNALTALMKKIRQFVAHNATLQSALGNLRGAINTAFAPIITWAIPILVRLINTITRVINAIASLTAGWFGKTAKQAQANAKAIDAETSAMGGLAKQTQKTLLGIDELNTLNDDSSGGGGGGAGKVPTTYSDDFSLDLAKSMETLGGDIARAINNAIASIDWYALGQYLGNGLALLIHVAWDFVTTLDWSAVGEAFALMLNGIISMQNPVEIGELLWGILTSGFDILLGFIAGFDVTQFVNQLMAIASTVVSAFANYIRNLDWGMLANKLYEFLYTFLTNENWGQIAHDILQGLVEGLFGFISLVLDAFLAISHAIVEWVLRLFGIHSPSTVFAEIGKQLMEGLIVGVQGMWETVKQLFVNLWNTIKNVFATVRDWFRQTFNNGMTALSNAISGAVEKVRQASQTIWNTIKGVFSTVAEWFRSTFQNAWENVKNVFSSGGQVFKGITDGITATFKKIVNSLIGGINNVIASPFNAINNALDRIRNISIAGLYPFYGKLPWISVPQIPYLAKGTVVPPNRQFMAMLGDNTQETEVVSPLSTMKQALAEALAESGGQHVVVNIDGRQLFDIVVNQNNSEVRRTGMTPLLT